MTNEELVKGLTELIRSRIDAGWNRMGVRCETEHMKHYERSKAVRSYIIDVFGGFDEVEGLHELEHAIYESIEMYYCPNGEPGEFVEPDPEWHEPEPEWY